MVISNHFLCKDLVHHPTETTIKKWMFRVPGEHVRFCGGFPISPVLVVFFLLLHVQESLKNVGKKS